MKRVRRWVGKRKMPPPCTVLSDQEAMQVCLLLRRELREDGTLSDSDRDAVRKVMDALNTSVLIRIEVDERV